MMMSGYAGLPSGAQSTYYDYVSSLLDDEASELSGSIIEKEIRGQTYLYDQYRVGNKTIQKYIGRKTDTLLSRYQDVAKLKEGRKRRRQERSRMAKKLRAEGVLALDIETGKVLSAMAKSGVFRLGGVLVGTNAFRAYELELGARYETDSASSTRDIDIAGFEKFSVAVGDFTNPEIGRALADLGYDGIPGIDKGQFWRWRTDGQSQTREVEFLTPSFEEDEGVRYLPSMQVHAQSLHYLNYLIREPVKVGLLYRDGVLVQVPRPERFAIHKLILAHRRAGRSVIKARKDLQQAEMLIRILRETRPTELEMAYQEAMDEGPKWREHIEGSLNVKPHLRDLLVPE